MYDLTVTEFCILTCCSANIASPDKYSLIYNILLCHCFPPLALIVNTKFFSHAVLLNLGGSYQTLDKVDFIVSLQ